MRLLNVTTKELRWFDEGNRPPYAILSHTWGPEEVSLQEIRDWKQSAEPINHPVASKDGFRKIRGCCEVAQREEIKWVWIDTCNIDSTSSAELSEAINSMFRWYRDAVFCIVYLADVSSTLAEIRADESQFRESRWFTRGWTLQELVAPAQVQFFNNQWKIIATRPSLLELIQDITQIPPQVFYGWPLASFSIAQRMSWAAGRDTTRTEDIAYCLLGLFEINMPLLYGEGNKAFRRLQEEIIRQTNDSSILAWGFRTKPSYLDFSGEDETISALARWPSDFAGCHDLTTFGDLRYDWGLFEITKTGLRLKLPLVRITDEYDKGGTRNQEYTAALINCREVGNPIDILALPIRIIPSPHESSHSTIARERGTVPFLSPLMLSHFAQVETCQMWLGDYKSHRDPLFPLDMIDDRAFIKASRNATFEVLHLDPHINATCRRDHVLVYETGQGQGRRLRKAFLSCNIALLRGDHFIPFYIMIEFTWNRSYWSRHFNRTVRGLLALPNLPQQHTDFQHLEELDWKSSLQLPDGIIAVNRFPENRSSNNILLRYSPNRSIGQRAHEVSAVLVDLSQHFMAMSLIDYHASRLLQRSAGLGGTLHTGAWVVASLVFYVLAIISLHASLTVPSCVAATVFLTFSGNVLLYLCFSRGVRVLRILILLALVTLPVWFFL